MRLALLAAAATGVQVGAALLASEAVVAEVGAGRLGFLRYAIGLVFLLPFALKSASAPIARRDLLPVSLLGIGQFGILIALLNLALYFTASARVSLVFSTLPLATIAVAWLLLRSAVSGWNLAAILGTIVGVALLFAGEALTGVLQADDLAGLGLAAAATLTGALCSALYRPYLQAYGVIRVSVLAMAASLVPLGAMALVEGAGAPMDAWSLRTLLLIGFVGLSSGVGYLMWLYALANAPAGIVTAFLALSPVTTVGFTVLWQGGALTPSLLAALVLVIGGLVMAAIGSREAREAK